MKLFVVDKDKGPAQGARHLFHRAGQDEVLRRTGRTSAGYAEVLVPVGKTYDITYL